MAAKCVPWLLIVQQKQGHSEACSALKEEFQNDPNFFPKWSQMNHGTINTIIKLSNTQPNERP